MDGVEEVVLASDEIVSDYQRKPVYEAVKRVQDFAMALAAIVLMLPIWILIAILVRFGSDGPVIFKQTEAVGRYGKRFTMYKFRTMYVDRDDDIHRDAVARFINGQALGSVENDGEEVPIYKLPNDPRVTPIGRLLRKSGLDEVPQFVNVLSGDLSLVGPRPAISYEYDDYSERHKTRLVVLPGITGLYQVTARSQVPFEEMVEIDLDYINRRSVWLDLKIMLMTPFVLMTGKGAY